MRSGAATGHVGYFHETALYGSDDELMDLVVPFLREGLEAGEPTVVTFAERNATLVRKAFGANSGLTMLPGADQYARPAVAIRSYREMLGELMVHGAPQIRIVGDVPHTGTGANWDEWVRYEAAVNELYDLFPLWGLCPYDTRHAPPEVIADVLATHPRVATAEGHLENPQFGDPRSVLAGRTPMPKPARPADEAMSSPSAAAARRRAATVAGRAELGSASTDTLLIVVSELVANAALHGSTPFQLELWAEDERVEVAVTDAGPGLTDPLAGLVDPGDVASGRGLWIADQLCSSISFGQTADGFTVRAAVVASRERVAAYAELMKPNTRFLLGGLAAAANSANAIKPAARFGHGAAPSFAFGVVPSEWPIQVALAQAATGALLARDGGRKGWRGAVGLAGYGASFAGLAYMHREAKKAGGILEQALVDELGADYRSRITEEFTPKPEVALTRRQLLLPDVAARRRYRRARNVSYGEYGVRNHLDVWKRADLPDDAKAPVLLQVHGGAWVVGMKEGQAETTMSHLAERGWVVVTTNYRLSPKATWPDHIVDVKRALAWTKANIADYGGDPDFVAITGGSAGGHLASLAALTPNLADFQPGFEDADTTVQAGVPFYGVYDLVNRDGTGRPDMEDLLGKYVFKSRLNKDRARWEQASTMSHVGPDAPPMFMLHGKNDSLVPVEQARAFVEMLRKESTNHVVYAELPGAQHAFEILPSIRAYACAHAVERFLAVVRSESVTSR